MPVIRRLFPIAVLLLILGLVLPVSSPAQEPGSHARIVRISYVQGSVEFNGQPAIVNTPVTQEGRLVTGTDGLAEVEFEDASKIRLASETEVTFAQLARLSTGETMTRVDLDEGEAEFLIPASSAGSFAVNVRGKNILFKTPGRFRILSTHSTPMELAAWKGEAEVHDLESGQQVSVRDRETFTLNPTDLGEYDLEKSVLADDLDRWSEQRDEELKTNYVASNPTYNVYNQYYQTGGGYPGYVPPYVYDFNAFGGCPSGWGFGQPFWFAGNCWGPGFGFGAFGFSPFLFPPPVVVVVAPPILPRRRPTPIRPPVVPTIAKGGPVEATATPRFRSFRDQGQTQRVFNDETFQRTPQQPTLVKPGETAQTPVVAPGQRSGNSNVTAPAHTAPAPTHTAPAPTHVSPPAQAPRSSPPAARPPSPRSFSGAGSRGPSMGSFSHASAPASHSSGGHR